MKRFTAAPSSSRGFLLLALLAVSVSLFLGQLTASAAPLTVGAESPTANPGAAPAAPQPAPALHRPAAPDVVLYDQYDLFVDNGVDSSSYSTLSQFNDRAADDFDVPAGSTWSINQVDVRSSSGNPPGPSFNVFFFNNSDSGGFPGSEVAARSNLSYSGVHPDYTIPLVTPVVLGPGHYWLSVQSNMSSSSWYWTMRSVQSSSAAAWQEAGGYNTNCVAPAWFNRGTCYFGTSSTPDQVFRLNGTGAPTAVVLAHLAAGRIAGGTAVSWRTASEVELAGFNLYRGGLKLNHSLIPAKHPGTSSGATYRFVERSLLRPAEATYRLELVRLDGRRAFGGTTTLKTGR